MSFEIVGGAVSLALTVFLLREVGFKGAPVITVISAALIFIRAVGLYGSVIDSVIPLANGYFDDSALGDMLKVTGLTYLFGVSSDVCREIGESGISKALDMVGRVEILLIAVPYIKEVIMLGADLI